jgi:hypothetical protein
MTAGTITAACTGIVSVVGAVTALVVALKAKGNATAAQQSATAAHARIDALTGKGPASP